LTFNPTNFDAPGNSYFNPIQTLVFLGILFISIPLTPKQWIISS
jgi:thiosulfate reductase cytochrome b subunit